MGKYYTCNICGATEKAMLPGCGCAEKEAARVLAKKIGAKVIDVFIHTNAYGTSIVEKLESSEGVLLFIVTDIDPEDSESVQSKVWEIDEERYNEFKNEVAH